MQVKKVNFSNILKENEETYLKHLEGIVSSVDIHAFIQITKRNDGVGLRISPSEPIFFNLLLEEIKKFHTAIGILVDFSKSMKAGGNITFNIDF